MYTGSMMYFDRRVSADVLFGQWSILMQPSHHENLSQNIDETCLSGKSDQTTAPESLGGTARWLQLQPSSAWPRRRKRSKMFSLCTIRMTARSSWDSSGFYTFMSRLSSCFAGVIWFPYDVIMAKEKCGLDDGCTTLICSTDDGCTRWWRWLHYFGRVIFDTHTADLLQNNMPIGCMIVIKWYLCKIYGAYAHLNCITSNVADFGDRHSMQVTHSYKERIFHLFPPQLKINSEMIWHHKLKLPLSAKYS